MNIVIELGNSQQIQACVYTWTEAVCMCIS